MLPADERLTAVLTIAVISAVEAVLFVTGEDVELFAVVPRRLARLVLLRLLMELMMTSRAGDENYFCFY